MYEKTIGTAKVNNAYEWQKVSYSKSQPTTTQSTKPKQKQLGNKNIKNNINK